MQLYQIGKVPWEDSQLIYHALAQLGREALSLVSPAAPYVCIGYHQDLQQEVDLAYCRANNIPLFRREVGGGAVFLDGNQLFFHLIIKKDNPLAPKRIDAFYQKFLQPIIAVHHRIGIPVAYKPVNDLVIDQRKISGTGAGEIGDCVVFVGNLILDFDYVTMARVLKIPDEKFRDKVRKTIEENLTTIRRELDGQRAALWDENRLNRLMAEEFGRLLGPLSPAAIDSELTETMHALKSSMLQDDWLFRKGKRVAGRMIKVKSGLELVQRMHKAGGGLIRAEFAVHHGCLKQISISGDYFCFPKDAVARLASRLEDCPVENVPNKLAEFYRIEKFEMPGVMLDDWLQVFRS